jgi:hypothetical protein
MSKIKIRAYASSTRPNAMWSAAQFNSAAEKNRTECDIPLVSLEDHEAMVREATERAEEAVKAANALQSEVGRLRSLLPASDEAICRLIHDHAGTGSPDEPLHHPAQKSWEEPMLVRWQQWEGLVDELRELLHALPTQSRAE